MKIQELQDWVQQDWEQSSLQQPSLALQLLYIMEEVGEIAEAIRKTSLSSKPRVNKDIDLGSEMADLLISITTLANSYQIDLTKEIQNFQAKLLVRHNQGY